MRGARLENTGLGSKIAVIVGAVLLLTAVGLAIYGGMAAPPRHDVVKVLPDERFAH